jgi:hypothetical protein
VTSRYRQRRARRRPGSIPGPRRRSWGSLSRSEVDRSFENLNGHLCRMLAHGPYDLVRRARCPLPWGFSPIPASGTTGCALRPVLARLRASPSRCAPLQPLACHRSKISPYPPRHRPACRPGPPACSTRLRPASPYLQNNASIRNIEDWWHEWRGRCERDMRGRFNMTLHAFAARRVSEVSLAGHSRMTTVALARLIPSIAGARRQGRQTQRCDRAGRCGSGLRCRASTHPVDALQSP